jgi:hypothetical protein
VRRTDFGGGPVAPIVDARSQLTVTILHSGSRQIPCAKFRDSR